MVSLGIDTRVVTLPERIGGTSLFGDCENYNRPEE
jgi:hypothetical protein